jgi:hypothetical protein
VLCPQEKQLVSAPILSSTIPAAQQLELGKTCSFDAGLGLAGANSNSSSESAADSPTKKSLRV